VEVKIGVENVQRELVVDTDTSPEDVQSLLEEALAGSGVFRLVDTRGRSVAVPAAKVAYLEMGPGTSGTVGFR
jgi:hypothetical protein